MPVLIAPREITPSTHGSTKVDQLSDNMDLLLVIDDFLLAI